MVSFEEIKGDNTNPDKILDRRANISQDGKILAISYPENSESGTNKGKVSVFQIGGIDTQTNWRQAYKVTIFEWNALEINETLTTFKL